jgi:hypothetical protein
MTQKPAYAGIALVNLYSHIAVESEWQVTGLRQGYVPYIHSGIGLLVWLLALTQLKGPWLDHFYLPLTSMLLVSGLLTLILWFSESGYFSAGNAW